MLLLTLGNDQERGAAGDGHLGCLPALLVGQRYSSGKWRGGDGRQHYCVFPWQWRLQALLHQAGITAVDCCCVLAGGCLTGMWWDQACQACHTKTSTLSLLVFCIRTGSTLLGLLALSVLCRGWWAQGEFRWCWGLAAVMAGITKRAQVECFPWYHITALPLLVVSITWCCLDQLSFSPWVLEFTLLSLLLFAVLPICNFLVYFH